MDALRSKNRTSRGFSDSGGGGGGRKSRHQKREVPRSEQVLRVEGHPEEEIRTSKHVSRRESVP